ALAKLRAALREYVKANDLHHRQIWIDADDDPDSAETLTFELEDAREHAIEGEFGMHLDEMSGRGLWIMTEIDELLTDFQCCGPPETNADMKKVREHIANDPMAVAIQRALKARKEIK